MPFTALPAVAVKKPIKPTPQSNNGQNKATQETVMYAYDCSYGVACRVHNTASLSPQWWTGTDWAAADQSIHHPKGAAAGRQRQDCHRQHGHDQVSHCMQSAPAPNCFLHFVSIYGTIEHRYLIGIFLLPLQPRSQCSRWGFSPRSCETSGEADLRTATFYELKVAFPRHGAKSTLGIANGKFHSKLVLQI